MSYFLLFQNLAGETYFSGEFSGDGRAETTKAVFLITEWGKRRKMEDFFGKLLKLCNQFSNYK